MKLLEDTEIFILPSEVEGFPTSLLEAGLKKCALIASNRGRIPEIIINEDYGILLNEITPLEIKESIEKILDSDELRNKIGIIFKKRFWKILSGKKM